MEPELSALLSGEGQAPLGDLRSPHLIAGWGSWCQDFTPRNQVTPGLMPGEVKFNNGMCTDS